MSYYDRRDDRDRDRWGRNYCRLYVGRISRYTRERDLKDLFSKCGRLRQLEMKNGFAFIEYEDPRDAEDAIRDFDGYKLEGERLQVELARSGGSSYRAGAGGPGGGGSGGFPDRGRGPERCYNCGNFGHWARDCPEPTGRGERAKRFEENKCFECGGEGHKARECPNVSYRGPGGGGRSGGRSSSPQPRRSSRSHSPPPRRDSSSRYDDDRRRDDRRGDDRGDDRERGGEREREREHGGDERGPRDRYVDERERRGSEGDRRD